MHKLRLKPFLLAGAMLPLAGAVVLHAFKRLGSLHVGRNFAASAHWPFGHEPNQPLVRVLVMGDSTGLGIGAQPRQLLSALLAADRHDAEVLNISRSGANLGDIANQLRQLPHSHAKWDLLLLHAGGNDIFRGTSPACMQREANALLEKLVPLARQVVWLGPANIGLLPAFVSPFSWLLSRRSAHASALFKQCAERFGVRFVDFCKPRAKETAEATHSAGADRWQNLAPALRH